MHVTRCSVHSTHFRYLKIPYNSSFQGWGGNLRHSWASVYHKHIDRGERETKDVEKTFLSVSNSF